ncbi:hypothetical protein LZL87_007154 [Fusarium oxysporum]|uniref:Uncharacterized protein n=1 Tax=Fusarium oxysporum f. sp. rapae TaxID=485398 RepID=A0A8J5P4Q0_FUSOX|nr:hypothetical protein Forpe1208_v010405 [Fusarium oxysporum f. sp. rapae]KAI7765403.1 hypothetical protein LZL87_007154 [Fusarium oxysporum]
MKLTTLATTIFALGFGADLATAAKKPCCDMKVCDQFDLKGNCKTECYSYKTQSKINASGLKSSILSAKTDTDCYCTIGKDVQSCMMVDSWAKGTNAPQNCQTGIKNTYCQKW